MKSKTTSELGLDCCWTEFGCFAVYEWSYLFFFVLVLFLFHDAQSVPGSLCLLLSYCCTALHHVASIRPKSVYAKLLTGDGVYPRLHPLVADSGNPNKHVAVDHKFSTESLLFPTSNTFETSPEAVFLIEAVVDLASESGLRFANDVISATSALESSMKTGSSSVSVSIAYRVIPSTAQSASLPFACLLANANIVGTENISALLSIEDVASKTAEELVAAIPNLADDKKAELTSLFASSSCVDQA